MIYGVSHSRQHWPTEKCLVCERMGLCCQAFHPSAELKAAALKPISVSGAALAFSTLERILQCQGHVKRAGTCQNE